MVAPEQLTLKTVLLHGHANDAEGMAAYRLLNDLGHDISTTDSATQAVHLMQHDRTDLVLVDADASEQERFVQQLHDLPANQKPRQVAIVTEAIDERLNGLIGRMNDSNVQVLLKPLHVHGLLKILRRIEGKA
jgi:DNA-binding NtrC family response regulator